MKFLKTTLIGGIVFLVPLTICVVILGKVQALMARLTAPLADLVPIDTVAGIAKANLIAILFLVLVCFAAGLFSRSRFAAWLIRWLESGFLQMIPGYAFFKGLTGGFAGDGGEQELPPVLARFDDGWQFALKVDSLEDGRIVLYLPGAPEPWSGSLIIMDAERVQPIDRSMAAAVRNLRTVGRGSREFLSPKVADRIPPADSTSG